MVLSVRVCADNTTRTHIRRTGVQGNMSAFNRSNHVGVTVDAKSNMKERKISNDVIYEILGIMF